MIKRLKLLSFLLVMGVMSSAEAGLILELKDGRKVELFKDHTWEFAGKKTDEKQEDRRPLKLTVEKVFKSDHNCKIGIRLTNKSGYYITSVVPRFSAYVDGMKVKFDSKSAEFNRLRPLRHQYREIVYRGITCGEIDYFRVHGADNCTMGDLDKFSAPKGACLAQIKVEPTDMIKIGKRKPK